MLSAPAPRTAHGLSDRQLSHAIDLSRILLIIGLVFLHYGTFPNSAVSSFVGLDPDAHPFATWVNSAVLFFFLSAVPLLSMISGWLFFSFAPGPVWPVMQRRMQRRITSLYLPLVVWNLAVFAGAYGLFLLRPGAMDFQGLNIDFSTAGALDFANAVLGLTHPPIAFQFWFVRDLLLTSLLSPLWWLLIRHLPWVGAAALGGVWLAGGDLVIFFRPDIPFFFYLGALIREKGLPVTLPLRTTRVLVGLYLLLAGLRPLVPYLITTTREAEPLWLTLATNAMRIVGVLGFWGVIYRLADTAAGRTMGSYGGLAFFLHSAHWPLLAVAKMILWPLLPATTDSWMLLHYGMSVALTTAIGLGSGLLLAARTPRLFALMNGGRLFRQPTRSEAVPLTARAQET